MKTESITNETIYTINWAEQDPRSVKASLNGKGDSRVLWWKIYQCIHQQISPQKTLEEITLSFHAHHSAITRFILAFRLDVSQITAVIRSKGVVAGIRHAVCVDGNRSER